MSALPKRYFTPEEYLALEERAEYKSQYVAGEIFAMSGAQSPHVFIETNLIGELRNRLRGRACNIFTSNMRVRAQRSDLYTYPDVAALCGKPEFDFSSKPESLTNPQSIFEVLSPSTEAFDRGDKFARYRRVESLVDYVLVASDLMRIEHYVRQDSNSWALTEYDRPTDLLHLRGIDCQLPLEEIYYQIVFPSGQHNA